MIPKKGDRIRLVRMDDDSDPIPPGSEGTVTHVEDLTDIRLDHTVDVDWDNGQLGLLVIPPDVIEVIQ